MCTEHELSFPGQEAHCRLAAKIIYFDTLAIFALILELVRDYKRFYFEMPDDATEEDKQRLGLLARTARDTFLSIFCEREEMESPGALTDFFAALQGVPTTDVASKLSEWCQDMLNKKEFDGTDRFEYIEAQDQQELNSQLAPLISSNPNPNNTSLWPLVKVVKIGIRGSRVADCSRTVDLPGIDDTNQVRVNASEEMLNTCDEIWIIARIGRVITDSEVDKMLSRWGKIFDVTLICTDIDSDIDPALAAHLRSKGQSVVEYDNQQASEEKLRMLLRQSEAKIAKKQQAKLKVHTSTPPAKKAKTANDAALKIQAEQVKAAGIQQELKEAKQAKFEALVDARIGFTTRRLQEEKAHHLRPGKTLKVFAVSNSHYAAHKLPHLYEIQGPQLDVSATGVPAVRAHVLKAAAPARLEAMETYVNYEMRLFMGRLAFLANRYAIKDSPDLLDAVMKPQPDISIALDSYDRNCSRLCRTHIVAEIMSQLNNLIQGATTIMHRKEKWHFSGLKAFIQNFGKHKTSMIPRHSWNDQFLEGANEIISAQWPGLETAQDEASDRLRDQMVAVLDRIETAINGKSVHHLFHDLKLTQYA